MQANTCLAVLNELTGMFGFFVQYVLLAGQCAQLTEQLPDGWGQGCKCGQTPAAICSSSAACSANATLQSPSCRAAALTCQQSSRAEQSRREESREQESKQSQQNKQKGQSAAERQAE